MRHAVTRTIMGIIWLIVAAVSLFNDGFLTAGIGLIVGIVYLSSANSIRKKEKDNK